MNALRAAFATEVRRARDKDLDAPFCPYKSTILRKND
jgi:hypothetical protein